MRTIPKPSIQRINSTMGTILVFRNPITKAWLFNLTIAKASNLEIDFRPNLALAKLAYTFALVAMVLIFFIGCNSTEPVPDSAGTVVTASHPKACIESFPVVPDTIIKSLEPWSLKVGNGTRNRCRWDVGNEWAECKAKSPDTLYAIDTYCPATLKARAELGGN